MAYWKTKTIDEIDDISEMVEAMKVLEVPSKGLKTLKEMKGRVRAELHLVDADKTPSWIEGKAFSILSKAKEEDAFKRRALLDFCYQVHTFLERLDENMLAWIRAYAGDVEEIAIQHIQQLTKKEYFLLVAGDTSAGKSSLINLILGEEILPRNFLSTTSTICELKYGKERRIVAHFEDKDPETGRKTRTILLEHPKVSSEKSWDKQISSYVRQKKDGQKETIFEKIEIFWPYDLLQKGIVIVDSPGVDDMGEMVNKYLPEAFAFIYVIDCANAKGVQSVTPTTLLEKVEPLGGNECSLFVCNKWDLVEEHEVENVKDHVTRKLQKFSSGLDPQSQIIYMSTTNAIKALNYGHITEGFLALMNGMASVVLKSINSRLEFHWRWLDGLLSRIIFQAKSFVKNAGFEREEAEKKMAQVLLRLESIKEKKDKVIESLNKEWRCRVDDVVKKLTEFLSSAAVKEQFTSWTTDEVPEVKSSWEQIQDQITKLLENRLLSLIEKWEEYNSVFVTARYSLLQHFKYHVDLVEVERLKLERDVVHDAPGAPGEDTGSNSWIPKTKTVVKSAFNVATYIGSNALMYNLCIIRPLPIFVANIAASFIGPKVFDKLVDLTKYAGEQYNMKKYQGNRTAVVTAQSADHLSAFTQKDALTQYVKEKLRDVELLLKVIEDRLPQLIEADKALYEKLMDEKRSKNEIRDFYLPLMDEANKQRGQLALFGMKEVYANEIKREELIWKEDTFSRLGEGAFATVYQGKMARHGVVQVVALKVCKVELIAENASSIMEEIKLLRTLDHPNIVKFHGTSLLEAKETTRVILVMEKCKEDLRSYILRHPKSVPGKSEDPVAVEEACQRLKEITDALMFLHEREIVHRDLKLENILVSEENSAKIADVGLAKPVVYITGTFAGTPIYIAPEVFHSKVYDSKADIYSLGIMMWEMWYGERAFANVQAESLQEFFRWVDAGNRPEHKEGYKNPPLRWQDLMKQCGEGEPKKRPTAEMCNKEIAQLHLESETVDRAASFPEVTPGEAVQRKTQENSQQFRCVTS